ncbi:MAG TPA: RNA-directed DNA polymerase, partial [Leucothrix mucor]|nr:RNA-directed DNA polymerase [Leucothrix mucor]
TQTVEMDAQRYYIHSKQRYLPQGAPTSPMISNIICRRLDARLQGLATKYGFIYTRYADDLTFSSQQTDKIQALLNWVKVTVKEEGFVLHPDKTRIMHQGARQEVTGIVVNQSLSVNRKLLKQFRALLFQLKKDGYAGKEWGKGGSLLPTIKGFAHYVKMVNPQKGEHFLAQIAEIIALHGYPSDKEKPARSHKKFRKASAMGQLPLASQHVAQPPSPPDIDKIIHHHDVLDQVREELGLSKRDLHKESKTDKQQATINIDTPDAGVLGFIKSLFGGKS